MSSFDRASDHTSFIRFTVSEAVARLIPVADSAAIERLTGEKETAIRVSIDDAGCQITCSRHDAMSLTEMLRARTNDPARALGCDVAYDDAVRSILRALKASHTRRTTSAQTAATA